MATANTCCSTIRRRTLPVAVTFYGADGRTVTRGVRVPAGAGDTLDVRRIKGLVGLHAAMLRATNGPGFVAEQTVSSLRHSTLRSTRGYA